MSADGDEDIEDRVVALEARVEEMREELRQLREAVSDTPSETDPDGGEADSGPNRASKAGSAGEAEPRAATESEAAPDAAAAARASDGSTEREAFAEPGWLNYVGIGLLLVGVGFLFEYAVDHGWLTESVRVVLVAGLGTLLLASGFRLESERPGLASVLRGGASATFYATVYAAFQLYGLIPHPIAFGLMIAVTAGTFVLSMREDDVVLAQIGALGAYGTPFMLYTGDGGVPGLVAYTTIVSAGIAAMYLYRGWRSLLATLFAGHWLVLTVARIGVGSDVAVGARVAVQTGVLVGWGLTGGIPIAARLYDRIAGAEESFVERSWLAASVVVVTPVVVAGVSRTLWEFPPLAWACGGVVGAACYAGLYRFVRDRGDARLASVILWAVPFGMTWALFEVTGGRGRSLGLAVETFFLVEGGRRLRERSLSAAAIVVAAATLLFVAVESAVGPAPAVGSAVLGIALVVVFGAVRRLDSSVPRLILHYAVHLVALSWVLATFGRLSNGQAWVSAIWAALGIAVTFAGAQKRSSHAHFAGLATVGLVVAKLFVVDLAELDPLWRIVLFVGLGGGFLLISSLAPGLLALESEESDPE